MSEPTTITDTQNPAAPVDVDACVRLLTRVAFLIERVGFDLDIAEMVGQEPEEENPPEDINLVEAEQQGQADGLRALASALAGMGKDSERLAKLAALVGDKDDRGVVTLGWENGSCCVWAGDDGDFQSGVGAGPDLASAIDNIEMESVDADAEGEPNGRIIPNQPSPESDTPAARADKPEGART